ncbi:ABC transporter ATP-binding protein [Altericista sp. CCNU0014]|uniref:ABC transporter ATP-binding protein n=1 Tax=Altericista sp. CCNU0014 TaxID=3082949 RepID=UPI00384D5B8B
MAQSSILALDGVVKRFAGATFAAVNAIALDLARGEILGLLGPSGCGKTTLLRLIAGFEKPLSGTIALAGQTVASARHWVPPERRDVGMVFQDYALFPHLNVAQNVAFGLQNPRRRLPQAKIQALAATAIAKVGLTGFEKRYPHELSGGQQQRVALARALAPQPTLILLDEPLSNLDVQVRLRLRQEIRDVLKSTGTSAIFVTHDQEEALSICDRIAVLHQGCLEQVGTPENLYYEPTSQFVSAFVTQANALRAQWHDGGWKTEIGWFAAPPDYCADAHQAVAMILQEGLRVQADPNSPIRICDRQFLGREYRYCLRTPEGTILYARSLVCEPLAADSTVQLFIDPNAVRVFPDTSG